MNRIPYATILLTAVLLATTALRAQEPAEQATGAGCATPTFSMEQLRRYEANTQRAHPELAAKVRQETSAARAAMRRIDHKGALPLGGSGVEYPFFVANQTTGQFQEITATLVYSSDTINIWVANDQLTQVKDNQVQAVVHALESETDSDSRNPAQGILQNNVDVFGPHPTPPNPFGNELANFLLIDIDMPGVLGYFYPGDQLSRAVFAYSNEVNMLYIDSREGLANLNRLLGIVAHEHQHLLHYARNPQSEKMYNEGCSELATILNGYAFRSNIEFLNNTNVDLFRYSDGNLNLLESDYERSMNFILYLYEQFGEPFITELVKARTTGVARINTALTADGYDVATENWNSVLEDFVVANYLQTNAERAYGYTFRPSTSKAKETGSYSGSGFPSDGSVEIEPYGSTYYRYTNPGGVTFRYSHESKRDARAVAMLYSGGSVEIRQLDADTDYTFADGNRSYDRIVIAVASMSEFTQTVNWTMTPVTLAVDDARTAAHRFSIAGVTPNPASTHARVRVELETADPVRLELYDSRGRLVRTLIDGNRIGAGSHDIDVEVGDLDDGVYMLRLRQGGRFAVRPMVVVR